MIAKTKTKTLALTFGLGLLASAQSLVTDPGVFGPALEIAHLYYDQWPTGEYTARWP